MGDTAAKELIRRVQTLLESQEYVNIIFAAAPSQNEFLSAFREQGTGWNRINAFHMDEYVGLDKEAPQGFGNFLKEKLFGSRPFREIHYLNGQANDLRQECSRYADLLVKYPADMVCLGIGENTHLAFNDPHAADFNDPEIVKVVELDETCRRQQVNDGCFAHIGQVPTHAFTITIPVLFKTPYASVVVPGEHKATAIYHTLYSEIGELYPSTILRRHENAILFMDEQSAAYIKP